MKAETEHGRLALLRLNALRMEWRSRFGEEPPAYASRELLLLALTYRLECVANRDLSPSAKKRLTELAKRFAHDRDHSPASRAMPSIGSALVRDWSGVRHVVLVTAEGFQYLDRTYGSLTQVATAITGQHRSGPHFFDLTGPAHKRAAP